MTAFRFLASLLVLALASTAALAQKPQRIRGDITSVEAKMMMVKSRDGQMLHINLHPELQVSVATAVKFEDIKEGDYVGITARKGADNKLTALEVHYIPPQAPEGHMPWDLAPNTSMTNARVAAMVSKTGARELTMKYKDGEQKIAIPEGIPLVKAVPGQRADLKAGEYIFTIAMVGNDGQITAQRVTVSKNGVKPPQ